MTYATGGRQTQNMPTFIRERLASTELRLSAFHQQVSGQSRSFLPSPASASSFSTRPSVGYGESSVLAGGSGHGAPEEVQGGGWPCRELIAAPPESPLLAHRRGPSGGGCAGSLPPLPAFPAIRPVLSWPFSSSCSLTFTVTSFLVPLTPLVDNHFSPL